VYAYRYEGITVMTKVRFRPRLVCIHQEMGLDIPRLLSVNTRSWIEVKSTLITIMTKVIFHDISK